MGIALDSDPHVQSTTCDKAFTNQHPPVSLFATARGGKTGMGADESQRLHTKPFLQQ